MQLQYDRSITHRNVPCDVHIKKVPLPGSDTTIQMEVFVPSAGVSFKNVQTTYFSVQLIAINSKKPDEKNKMTIMIDFYNIESFENDDETAIGILKQMGDDFNLPFGKGCSGFVESLQPDVTSQSFSLKYQQQTRGESILMAYDHVGGYLRKEYSADIMSVWDINENLMYHVDGTTASLFKSYTTYPAELKTCSVMDVSDDKLGSAFRPYQKSQMSLDVLKMIGASFVGYLGRTTVRDLPCLVFESIVTEPPAIFGLTEEQMDKKKTGTRDYIVQFFVLQGKTTLDRDHVVPENSFWPARIVLFRRLLDITKIEFIDQLEVYDFYWSLDGWDKKGTRLFMAQECFDDEDEQVRLDTAITFDRVHKGYTKSEDMLLLPMNKFKLEFDLIKNIFDIFQISRMHLIDYSLKLKPHHVNLNMVIGDRKEDKKLVYYGEGQLPERDSYESNRVVLTRYSEISCVLISSQMPDISLVLHCPSDPTSDQNVPTCVAVYDEHEPTISNFNDKESDSDSKKVCQVYRFEESTIAKRGTNIVHDKAELLYSHPIEFVANVPKVAGKTELLKGMINNYDISQETKLITIDRYMFVVDKDKDGERVESDKGSENTIGHNQRVRSFDSITYKSAEDCAKMCSLDAHCRSYSYCSNKYANLRCILTSLDLRNSKIQEQLVNSKLNDNKEIQVLGYDTEKYTLKLESSCNIYEHDYLNVFRQTDEIIRVDKSVAKQFQKASTTFECAKQSVDLESSSAEHHVAMFAYCAVANTCIMDENLFATGKSAANDESGDDDDEDERKKANTDQEIVCRIYRKRYQSYFGVSTKVLKRDSFKEKQVELSFNSVEDCARACWIPLGEVCASFDYCSPSSCLINQVGLKDIDENELEARESCLHYERDLILDELRKKHLIGRQAILGGLNGNTSSDSMSVAKTLLIYSIVFCAFVYGLFLGRRLSDKMDAVSILRQSVSTGSTGQIGSRQMFPMSLNGLNGNSNHGSSNGYDIPDDDGDEDGSSNAIRMDVIKKKSRGNDEDPLERDF